MMRSLGRLACEKKAESTALFSLERGLRGDIKIVFKYVKDY